MPRPTLLLPTLAVLIAAAPVRAQSPAVYRMAIAGSVDLDALRLLERTLGAAERAGASAVILEIGSSGGRFDMAQLIADELEVTGLPVYVLVGREAWGAAALVALAADSIFMAPGASIGAGRPPAERTLELSGPTARAVRNTFGRLAERLGAEPRVGAAMVPSDEAMPGAAETLLTLDADPAVEARIAAARVRDFTDLLGRLGLDSASVVTVGSAWTGTTVEVTNRNWSTVRIYILQGSSRFRLGTVTTMNTEVFEVSGALLGPGATIQLLVEVIGSSERITTERVQVEPGLVIQWVIENVLSQSNYFVWVRA